MKKLLLLFLFSIAAQLSFAQVIDKEKLLEFYQSQRYAEAAAYLESIYPLTTKDINVLGQMAYCNMMAGKLAEAAQQYQRIDSIQPNNLSILFNMAIINAKRGNDLKTKFYLEKILKLDTLNFNVLRKLADFTDSIPLKIGYLQKANKIKPTDADVASDLAACYRIKTLFEPGYKVLQVALAADTGNFILQREQLFFANELKKYKEVVAMGEKLLMNDPQDPSVLKDIGKAYFFLKNYERCLFYYQKVEQIGKQTEIILYYMTLCYRELKNYEMAAVYAKKTIDEGISPNTSFYYALLGGIYETNNQLSSSANAYKKGLTFNANSTIYYRLGLLNDLKLNKKNKCGNLLQTLP